jgi:hypothetical protein
VCFHSRPALCMRTVSPRCPSRRSIMLR